MNIARFDLLSMNFQKDNFPYHFQTYLFQPISFE